MSLTISELFNNIERLKNRFDEQLINEFDVQVEMFNLYQNLVQMSQDHIYDLLNEEELNSVHQLHQKTLDSMEVRRYLVNNRISVSDVEFERIFDQYQERAHGYSSADLLDHIIVE